MCWRNFSFLRSRWLFEKSKRQAVSLELEEAAVEGHDLGAN